MSRFAALGDIHTDWSLVDKLIEQFPREKFPDMALYQIGDFGIGLPGHRATPGNIYVPDPELKPRESYDDRFGFIRGNHDSPILAATHPNYLGDFGTDPRTGIFFVSGARSNDKQERIEGRDWWEAEELSMRQCTAALDAYMQARPKIVISHDAPPEIVARVKSHHVDDKSRTQQLLGALLENHRPRLWIFGHHHKAWQETIRDTTFVCLDINEIRVFAI